MLVNLAQDQVDSFITSIQLKHALKLFESNNGAICDSKPITEKVPFKYYAVIGQKRNLIKD